MTHEDSVDLYDDLLGDSLFPGYSADENSSIGTESANTAVIRSVTETGAGLKDKCSDDGLTVKGNVSSANSAPAKLSFHSILSAIVERENQASPDQEDGEGAAVPADKTDEGSQDDLMNDVYSLHTERDIQHRKELQGKQEEIKKLLDKNSQLTAHNNQLRHNIALLLATAKKEIETQKNLILTLRKQLITTEPFSYNRQFTYSRAPYQQQLADPQITKLVPMSAVCRAKDAAHHLDSGDTFKTPIRESKSPNRYVGESSNVKSPPQKPSPGCPNQTPSRNTHRIYNDANNSKEHRYRAASCVREVNKPSDLRSRITSRSRIDKAKENLRQRQQSVAKTSGRAENLNHSRERYERLVRRSTSRARSVSKGSKSQTSDKENCGNSQNSSNHEHYVSRKRDREPSIKPSNSKRRRLSKHSPRKSPRKHRDKSKHCKRADLPVIEDDSISDLLRLKESLLSALGEDSSADGIAHTENTAATSNNDAKTLKGVHAQQSTDTQYISEHGSKTSDQIALSSTASKELSGGIFPDSIQCDASSLPTPTSHTHYSSNEVPLVTANNAETALHENASLSKPVVMELVSDSLAQSENLSKDRPTAQATIADAVQINNSVLPTAIPLIAQCQADNKATEIAAPTMYDKQHAPSDNKEPSNASTSACLHSAGVGIDVDTGRSSCNHSKEKWSGIKTTSCVKETTCTSNDNPSEKTRNGKSSSTSTKCKRTAQVVEIPLDSEGDFLVDPRKNFTYKSNVINLLPVEWRHSHLNSSQKLTAPLETGISAELDVVLTAYGSSLTTNSSTSTSISLDKVPLAIPLTADNKSCYKERVIGDDHLTSDRQASTGSSHTASLESCSDQNSTVADNETVNDSQVLGKSQEPDSVKYDTLEVMRTLLDNVVSSENTDQLVVPKVEVLSVCDSFTSVLDACPAPINKKFKIPKKKNITPDVSCETTKPLTIKTEIINPYAVAPNRRMFSSCLREHSNNSIITDGQSVHSVEGQRKLKTEPCRRKSSCRDPYIKKMPTADAYSNNTKRLGHDVEKSQLSGHAEHSETILSGQENVKLPIIGHQLCTNPIPCAAKSEVELYLNCKSDENLRENLHTSREQSAIEKNVSDVPNATKLPLQSRKDSMTDSHSSGVGNEDKKGQPKDCTVKDEIHVDDSYGGSTMTNDSSGWKSTGSSRTKSTVRTSSCLSSDSTSTHHDNQTSTGQMSYGMSANRPRDANSSNKRTVERKPVDKCLDEGKLVESSRSSDRLSGKRITEDGATIDRSLNSKNSADKKSDLKAAESITSESRSSVEERPTHGLSPDDNWVDRSSVDRVPTSGWSTDTVTVDKLVSERSPSRRLSKSRRSEDEKSLIRTARDRKSSSQSSRSSSVPRGAKSVDGKLSNKLALDKRPRKWPDTRNSVEERPTHGLSPDDNWVDRSSVDRVPTSGWSTDTVPVEKLVSERSPSRRLSKSRRSEDEKSLIRTARDRKSSSQSSRSSSVPRGAKSVDGKSSNKLALDKRPRKRPDIRRVEKCQSSDKRGDREGRSISHQTGCSGARSRGKDYCSSKSGCKRSTDARHKQPNSTSSRDKSSETTSGHISHHNRLSRASRNEPWRTRDRQDHSQRDLSTDNVTNADDRESYVERAGEQKYRRESLDRDKDSRPRHSLNVPSHDKPSSSRHKSGSHLPSSSEDATSSRVKSPEEQKLRYAEIMQVKGYLYSSATENMTVVTPNADCTQNVEGCEESEDTKATTTEANLEEGELVSSSDEDTGAISLGTQSKPASNKKRSSRPEIRQLKTHQRTNSDEQRKRKH